MSVTAPSIVPFMDLSAQTREVVHHVRELWAEIARTSGFIGGDIVTRFETAFAAYCGVDHCVGVANGTDALELVLAALGIGPGDEVIVPANTFVATVSAVIAVGATPVFVDVDPGTLLVTPELIAEAIGPSTAAIIVVHLYGQMPDMPSITRLAARSGVAVVEDAAQAHGATWNGQRAGSYGRAAAFSFYPGKNLGAFGDAGAVVTDDAALAERVRVLANHGRSTTSRHHHETVGRNSRLDALQAAVLAAKLPHLDLWNERRGVAAARYRELLIGSLCRFVDTPPQASSVHHLAVCRVPRRDDVVTGLTAHGIAWGLHYPVPCHLQPAFARYCKRPLPNAERAARELVSLPMFPTITRAQIVQVASALLDATGAGIREN